MVPFNNQKNEFTLIIGTPEIMDMQGIDPT